MPRPTWDEYFVSIAHAVALRADCSRRRVGAVLVSPDHRVISTGYNGSPPGGPSCLEGECPRGRHYLPYDSPGFCTCGEPWPCAEGVAPGSSYDTGAGACIANHAEGNALLYAGASNCAGATLYITDAPCGGCARLISGVGIIRTVYPGMEKE
jgi:dCMP deaminase